MNGLDPIWNNGPRESIHGILSDIQFLLSDIPHGSVLGPLIFTMYTRPLGIIVQRYGVKYHFYTDDTSCIYHWILTMS